MPENTYERNLNIKTSDRNESLHQTKKYHRYEPTPYVALDQLFEHIELNKQDVVVDFGSGKGRVPFYIHSRFQNTIKGVEISDKMHQKAMRNKQNFRRRIKRKKHRIRFKNMDALDYEIKKEDNVFFFFNPFHVSIFRKVVQNIIHSYHDTPRKIKLLMYYENVDYLQFLKESTPFRLKHKVHIHEMREKEAYIYIFELKPS